MLRCFERQGRRLLLNDRGRQILPDVRDVLMKVRVIEQFLDDSVGEPSGTLKVGASTTIGNYILPAIVGDFSQRYPQATALLQIGNAQQIEKAVENGELDLGLVEGLPHVGSLTSTAWRHDELVVIVGQAHEWSHKNSVTPDMLKNAAWIMREKGSGTREVFEAAMEKQGVACSIATGAGPYRSNQEGRGGGAGSRLFVENGCSEGIGSWLAG